mgnify:CR=1 FL=1
MWSRCLGVHLQLQAEFAACSWHVLKTGMVATELECGVALVLNMHLHMNCCR